MLESQTNTVTPRAETLLEAFKSIYLNTVTIGEQIHLHITPLSDLQLKILSLLGFSPDIYSDWLTILKTTIKMSEWEETVRKPLTCLKKLSSCFIFHLRDQVGTFLQRFFLEQRKEFWNKMQIVIGAR